MDAARTNDWSALSGLTMLICGGTTGVGPAIGNAAAKHGVNVAVLTRSDGLPRTLRGDDDGAVPLSELGIDAVGIPGDIRSAHDVERAVAQTHARFGGIDLLVLGSGALCLGTTESITVEEFDLLMGINLRGNFLIGKAALPYLVGSSHAHILSISPPIGLSEDRLRTHVPYTLTRSAASLLTLAWAAEYVGQGVAANCLWPEIEPDRGHPVPWPRGSAPRSPEIMADAALELLSRPPPSVTGRCLSDLEVLRAAGIDDPSRYRTSAWAEALES